MAVMQRAKRVDVLTFFQDGKIDPIKFRMNGKVYQIRRVHRRWKARQGAQQIHHFLIEADGPGNYELDFNPSKFTWDLRAIAS